MFHFRIVDKNDGFIATFFFFFGQFIDFTSFGWKHLVSNDNSTKNMEIGLRPEELR